MRRLIFLVAALFLLDVRAGEGDIISAIKVTRAEMIRILSKEPDDWEYAKFVNNIDNYNIGISELEKQVVVVYVLKRSRVRILGGRVDFFVSKNPLVIEKIVRHK